MPQYRLPLILGMILALLTLGFWLAPSPASAEDVRYSRSGTAPAAEAPVVIDRYQPKCYTGLDGDGDVITWARNERECRYESAGQSWGDTGHYTNIYRDGPQW